LNLVGCQASSSSLAPYDRPATVSTPSLVSEGGSCAISSSAPQGSADVVALSKAYPSAHCIKYPMDHDDLHAQNHTAAITSSPNCSVSLTLAQKSQVVHFLATEYCISVNALRSMCARHHAMQFRIPGQTRTNATDLHSEFLAHECTSNCLILRSEAALAGILTELSISEEEVNQSRVALANSTKKRRNVDSGSIENPGPTVKRARVSMNAMTSDTTFPILLSQHEKYNIVREFRESTNNEALRRHECSFCGKLELASRIKLHPVHLLDISLLTKAVEELRTVSQQQNIESFKRSSMIDNSYVLCHLCNLSVARNMFESLPVRSYANGLWIGDVPNELQDLTFLEEQCIARARATRYATPSVTCIAHRITNSSAHRAN
jgi:hypothetical protein